MGDGNLTHKGYIADWVLSRIQDIPITAVKYRYAVTIQYATQHPPLLCAYRTSLYKAFFYLLEPIDLIMYSYGIKSMPYCSLKEAFSKLFQSL